VRECVKPSQSDRLQRLGNGVDAAGKLDMPCFAEKQHADAFRPRFGDEHRRSDSRRA
jgi:hypothetical protein